MKKNTSFICVFFIFFAGILQGYNWPVKVFTKQHGINATLGEWRPGHFHAGVDINAPCSTKVYTIEGDTCYIDSLRQGKNNKTSKPEFRETALDFNMKYNVILLINQI